MTAKDALPWPRVRRSCRCGKNDVVEARHIFPVLDPFHQCMKGNGLDSRLGFRLGSTLGERAGNLLDLGNEPAVLFKIKSACELAHGFKIIAEADKDNPRHVLRGKGLESE